MNETKLFFFLGQSGAGKGTQVAMVLELLKTMGRDVLYVAMGDEVRGTVKILPDDNFFKNHMKTTNDQGKLQPAVIPLHFFLKKFIPEFIPGQIIIIDGSPRSQKEFELWQSLIDFGYIPKSYVVNIDVSDPICIERLKNRPGRTDTLNMESLQEKLAWYTPVRDILKNPPQGFQVIHINGELSVEQVFSQIKKEMEIVLKG